MTLALEVLLETRAHERLVYIFCQLLCFRLNSETALYQLIIWYMAKLSVILEVQKQFRHLKPYNPVSVI